MINRLQNNFGRMFEECFYLKKYKKSPSNIWKFMGIIELNVCPNIFKTGFSNTYKYRAFYRKVFSFLNSLYKEKNVIEI